MKILITGTSSGIGQTLAEQLGAQGHELWGWARRPQEEFVTRCRHNGINFRAATCDVSNWQQVQTRQAEVKSVWPHLDGLICCAAIQAPIGPTMEIDPELWARNLAVNLHGTFHCLRAFHQLLLQAPRRAKIICFSGGGATSPRPNFSAYAAAKTAVVRLVENLSHEWHSLPIDINAIAPGPVNTGMTDELLSLPPSIVGEDEFNSASKRKTDGATPMEKYVGLTRFLLSPDSDGISGRLLSAPWDPWNKLNQRVDELKNSDIYTLRRITPPDRRESW